MTTEEVQKLPHGLYRLHYKEESGGGYSLAAVGSMYDGTRWMACCNWTAPSTRHHGSSWAPGTFSPEGWDKVDRAELILTRQFDANDQ